jgi:hypothetical protein
MTVTVLDPNISIILKKTIGRTTVSGGSPASGRFQGQGRVLDLSPYLGESGQVTTSKSVRDAAGMFTIVLADKMDLDQFDSLYGIIEPMDVIEIRMAHDKSLYQSSGFEKNMPITMRGFVTNVVRDESITNEGPQRTVTIRGQDYGKLLQIMQIAYLPNEVTGSLMLTMFNFFMNYSSSDTPSKSSEEFMTDIVTNVANKFITSIQGQAGGGAASPVLSLQLDISVTEGVVLPFGTIQKFEGTVFDMMSRYGDVGPWNELFIEDREDGPYVVYRPTPFKDATGAMIQGGAAPAFVPVTDKDLVGLSVTRSDGGVYNYYWVNPVTFNMNTPGFLAVQEAHSSDTSSFYLADYPNCDTKLYGFRRLEVETQQGPRYDGQSEAEYESTQMGPGFDFTSARRATLVANNKDNVIFESGTMQLSGNEAIKPGMTVQLTRANAAMAEYYAVMVQHIYRPFKLFMTTVTVERGTGFINRVQKNTGNAYLEEIYVGGVYGQG